MQDLPANTKYSRSRIATLMHNSLVRGTSSGNYEQKVLTWSRVSDSVLTNDHKNERFTHELGLLESIQLAPRMRDWL